MERHFDAVIFDFGGVLTTSPFTAIQDMAANEADGAALLELMLGPYDQDTDHPFHRLERGESTGAEYGVWLVGQLAALELSIESRGGGLDSLVTVIPSSVDAVREVRAAGYRTALLTNNIAHERETWRAMLPLDELFDVIVDSSEVGMRKPDPRIFDLTLAELGVDAGRAVFLDDAPGNVAAARGLGLSAILVGEPVTAALEELRGLLTSGPDTSGVAPPSN